MILFGVGRRGCLGIFFVLISVEFVLVNFVYVFDWKLVDGVEGGIDNLFERVGVIVSRRDFFLVIVILYFCS